MARFVFAVPRITSTGVLDALQPADVRFYVTNSWAGCAADSLGVNLICDTYSAAVNSGRPEIGWSCHARTGIWRSYLALRLKVRSATAGHQFLSFAYSLLRPMKTTSAKQTQKMPNLGGKLHWKRLWSCFSRSNFSTSFLISRTVSHHPIMSHKDEFISLLLPYIQLMTTNP